MKLSKTLNLGQKGDMGSHTIVVDDLRDRVVQRKEICEEGDFKKLVFI